MAGQDQKIEIPLVVGRECGTCNVCCVALTIDDPELRKPQGYRCRNARPDNGCAIYETRPRACRAFFCGWRSLKWVSATLRPETSGVLIRLHNTVSTATGTTTMGVVFTLLNSAALKAEGLAESVAAAVAAEIPVYLNVPGPPGYTSGQAQINDVLVGAVAARDKAGILSILRKAHARGRSGRGIPVSIASRSERSGEG